MRRSSAAQAQETNGNAQTKERFLSIMVKVFKAVDLSGDGVLSPDELSQAARKITEEKDREIYNQMTQGICDAAADNLGNVNFTKYMGACADVWDKRGAPPDFIWTAMENVAKLTKAEEALKAEISEGKSTAIQELKAMFDRYDTDASGTLDAKELKFFAAQMRSPMSDEELEAALADMDKSKTGSVSFDDLYRWWKSHDRSTKSTGALAGLYLAAANEYLTDGAKTFFAEKTKERASRIVDANMSIQMSGVDAKSAKGKVEFESFYPADEELKNEDTVTIKIAFAYSDSDKIANVAKVVSMIKEAITMKQKRPPPPPIRAAAESATFDTDEKSSTATFQVAVPFPAAAMVKQAQPKKAFKFFKATLLTAVNGLRGCIEQGVVLKDLAKISAEIACSFDKSKVLEFAERMDKMKQSTRRSMRRRSRRPQAFENRVSQGLLSIFNGVSMSLKLASVDDAIASLPKSFLPGPLVEGPVGNMLKGLIQEKMPPRSLSRRGEPKDEVEKIAREALSLMAYNYGGLGSITSIRVVVPAAKLGFRVKLSPGFFDLGVISDFQRD